jgi:hypothetical protein
VLADGLSFVLHLFISLYIDWYGKVMSTFGFVKWKIDSRRVLPGCFAFAFAIGLERIYAAGMSVNHHSIGFEKMKRFLYSFG